MSNVTIQKRGKYYQYKFEIARVDGKRKFANKSGFKTKAEAEREGIIAYNNYINTGHDFEPCDMSYSDLLDYWLEKHCYINLKYHTIEAYSSIVKNHIKPNIGFYKISQITRSTLQEFINNIYIKKSFSKNFLNNIKKVVKGSFTYAYENDLLKTNPSIGLKLPKYDVPPNDPAHIFTNEEINLILDRFKNNHCVYYAFLTAYCTGLRASEVFALTWDDIDFTNRVINVKHTVYDKPDDGKGRWYIGTTKTKQGTRQINMSITLYNALINYKKKQQYLKKVFGNDYYTYHFEDVLNKHGKVTEKRIVQNEGNIIQINKADMVFTRPNGKYVGRNILNYPFKIIHKELGIDNCRFYDLRGSYATINLRNGTEIRDVADILGHKYIETTENFYISSTDENKKDVSNVFDSLMNSETINNIIKYEIAY